jgi:hypothetical protein
MAAITGDDLQRCEAIRSDHGRETLLPARALAAIRERSPARK